MGMKIGFEHFCNVTTVMWLGNLGARVCCLSVCECLPYGAAQSGSEHQFLDLPLADAFSNHNTTFTENKHKNATFWLLEQDSLGNAEDRASKAVSFLERKNPRSSVFFYHENLNFRYNNLTP